MNERIQKLAEQAGFVMWGDCDWKPEGEVIDWSSSYDDELEKFVELIRADERIKQAEKQEPVAWLSKCYNDDNEQIGYTVWDRDVGEGAFPVYTNDMSEKHVHEWVDLTQEEVDECYAETQDEFQFSQLLAYKLREKNFGFSSHTTITRADMYDDEFAEMAKKGTKAWTDTPNDWVDDLRGGIESCTEVGTNSGVLHKEWVGLDHEMMRNTPIEFNRGALWAERWLKEKNHG